MKIPHAAHVSKLAESAGELVTAHGNLTESVSNHAERHVAKLNARRKELEMSHAIQQGAERAAG